MRRNGKSVSWLSALVLLLIAACNSDDDPGTPGNPGDIAGDPFGSTALLAVHFGTAVGTLLPQWWAGDLSGSAKAATWDPETMSWVFGIDLWDETVTYPSSAGVYALVHLQYLAGGTPQQEAAGADEIAVVMAVGVHRSIFQDEANNTDISADFDVSLAVAALQGGGYAAQGGGTGGLQVYLTQNGNWSENFYENVAVTWDLQVPAGGGCPTGGSTLSYQGTMFSATFNGAANATWTFTGSGGSQASGNLALGCGG